MADDSMRWEARTGALRTDRRVLPRLGPAAVVFAILFAVATLLIFADYTPITPSSNVVLGLLVGNVVIILFLFGLLIAEAWRLVSAWRAGAAGARLHIRIVGLFSVIAAAPAILIAVVGSVTLDRSLNPAFLQDVRGFVFNTAEAARLFRESQCRSLIQEARLTASDLDRAKSMYDVDRALFHEFFASRVRFLGFANAVLMGDDGHVVERAEVGADTRIVTPEAADFSDARQNEPSCLILDEGRTFVALRQMTAFPDAFLYVSRPIDPFAIEFPNQAASLISLYEAFDAHRTSIQIAFSTMYVLLAVILLLSATWLGLSFATRLVQPIRRLIAATDQVSTGNLYVQVPVHRSDGDLAHLGETFNKMTSELRLQQNRLITANQVNDERRVFTEAVLSGVPAAIVGVDGEGRISVLNASAQRLLDVAGGAPVVGQPFAAIVPELAATFGDFRAGSMRQMSAQTTLVRHARERTYNVRLTTDPQARAAQSIVVTLDDITDLVQAQRTSAWADVARRIAHEIKNPLTPIQLSAERIKRKYGKVITQDREIFDQCTDTIVRQVDDIKRMVDEFSSFARMPKARLEEDDLAECVRQVLFLMRVGHPDVTMIDDLPAGPVVARFDRRLVSQALTNVVKNATEGVQAAARGVPGVVTVTLQVDSGLVLIDVSDNGIGFPTENRQRLLEPYMTTRAEGTGLGLPIVAKIFEDHGGGIELLDALDGPGARVRLFFPVARSDGLEAEAATATSYAAAPGG